MNERSLTEVQRTAAGMLGRGKTRRDIAQALGMSEQSITRWRKHPDFAAEEERVRRNSGRPDPYNVLLDALCARKDDGVDWPSRLNAAKELLVRFPDGDAPPEENLASRPARITVFAPIETPERPGEELAEHPSEQEQPPGFFGPE